MGTSLQQVTQSLSDTERFSLVSFRAAAREVDSRFRPYRDVTFSVHFGGPDGLVYTDLIPLDAFRSLVLALRLVYMPGEKAHVDRVMKVLRRYEDAAASRVCDIVSEDWIRARVAPGAYVVDGHTYTAGDVLDTWMYARAFHQDASKQADADRLKSLEPFTVAGMQLAVFSLCLCVRNLDIAVAYVLGEEPHSAVAHVEPARLPFF